MDRPGLILLRGGGDLASGIALRLYRAGLRLLIAELDQPLAVRRTVSFGEAVYEGTQTVEGVTARRVEPAQIEASLAAGEIPVLIDPEAEILLSSLHIPAVIDARLLKTSPRPLPADVPLHIGVGPGFHAGINCHAVIETRRSHTLGRLYWEGASQPDSGQPDGDPRRVLRAPEAGRFLGHKQIGEHCEPGELIAEIEQPGEDGKAKMVSPLKGVLRGLIRSGIHVSQGLKVGDIDPRDDASACYLVSDKALAIGGAALEAVLTRVDIRKQLW